MKQHFLAMLAGAIVGTMVDGHWLLALGGYAVGYLGIILMLGRDESSQ